MENIHKVQIRAVKAHPLEWLIEPLEEKPTCLRKKMFGCEAVYLNGRLVLVLAAGDEPWNGLLLVTGREYHSDLQREWKQLQKHSVLGKWLYLSQTHPGFEKAATAIVQSIVRGDTRIGVEPKVRKRKQAKPVSHPTSSDMRRVFSAGERLSKE